MKYSKNMAYEFIKDYLVKSIDPASMCFLPIDVIKPHGRFSNIVKTAYQKGLLTLTESDITPERIDRAKALAAKVVRNPVRSTGLTLFSHLHQGIPSSSMRGSKPNMYEAVQGGFNKVHFSFGIPYFYDTYIPDSIRADELPLRSTGLVVLRGDEIIKRPDLKIPFIDTGLLFKIMNPLADWINQTEIAHPEIIRTDNDPTHLLYSLLLANPAILDVFETYMHDLYGNYCLGPSEIEKYIGLFFASSFPLFPSDGQLLKSWQFTRSPEGNVDGQIKKDEIECIIVSNIDYDTVVKLYGDTGIRFVNAGPPYTVKTDKGITINTLHLLEQYMVEIDAPELQSYIDLLKSTQKS